MVSVVRAYFPDTNTNIYLGNTYPPSADIAHTSTKMWMYDFGITEYNITLNPWSVTQNRVISLPSIFSIGAGLAGNYEYIINHN